MKKITTGSKKVTVAASKTRKSSLSRLEGGLRQVLNTLDSMDDATFHEVEAILGKDFYNIILYATQDISYSH